MFDAATYRFASLSLFFATTVVLAQFFLTQSGKSDPQDIYILMSSPFKKDLPAAVIDAGGYRIDPQRTAFSQFVVLPKAGHAHAVASGHVLISASVLAALCGLNSKEPVI